MKTGITAVGVLAILILVCVLCERTIKDEKKSGQANTTTASRPGAGEPVFPSSEVCNYPSTSHIERYWQLGGGRWTYSPIEGFDLNYDCGVPEKRISWSFPESDGEIAVEYGALGTTAGAVNLGLDYSFYASRPVQVEPEFRRDFVSLVDEIVDLALGDRLPTNTNDKMRNLDGFSALGVRNQEQVQVGRGLIKINKNRNASNTTIVIKILICADQARCS